MDLCFKSNSLRDLECKIFRNQCDKYNFCLDLNSFLNEPQLNRSFSKPEQSSWHHFNLDKSKDAFFLSSVFLSHSSPRHFFLRWWSRLTLWLHGVTVFKRARLRSCGEFGERMNTTYLSSVEVPQKKCWRFSKNTLKCHYSAFRKSGSVFKDNLLYINSWVTSYFSIFCE